MILKNFEEYQTYAIAVRVVGDISHALKNKVLPFCGGIIKHLISGLCSQKLYLSLKPRIFVLLRDISLAIGRMLRSMLHEYWKCCKYIRCIVLRWTRMMMSYWNMATSSRVAYLKLIMVLYRDSIELKAYAFHLWFFIRKIVSKNQTYLYYFALLQSHPFSPKIRNSFQHY